MGHKTDFTIIITALLQHLYVMNSTDALQNPIFKKHSFNFNLTSYIYLNIILTKRFYSPAPK